MLQKGLALAELAWRARRTLSALHCASATLASEASNATIKADVFMLARDSSNQGFGVQQWSHRAGYIAAHVVYHAAAVSSLVTKHFWQCSLMDHENAWVQPLHAISDSRHDAREFQPQCCMTCSNSDQCRLKKRGVAHSRRAERLKMHWCSEGKRSWGSYIPRTPYH